MTPLFYRWDVYATRKKPGPWYKATPGKIRRVCHTLRHPNERLRVFFDNGQQCVYRHKSHQRPQ